MISKKQKLQIIKKNIVSINDFPKKGIIFYDILTLLNNPEAHQFTIDILINHYKNKNITKVVGIESRGFLFGISVALLLNVGFVAARKEKKLPRKSFSVSYKSEYNSNILEIHKNDISFNDNVLIIDDLIATGGTMEAAIKIVKLFGCNIIEVASIIVLPNLGCIHRLKKNNVSFFSLIDFV